MAPSRAGVCVAAAVTLVIAGCSTTESGERPQVCPDCVSEVVGSVAEGPDGVSYRLHQGEDTQSWGPTALLSGTDGEFYILDGAGPSIGVIDPGGEFTQVPLSWPDLRSLMGLAVIDGRFWVLDITRLADPHARLVRVGRDGEVIERYNLPPELSLERGLTGLSSGPTGDLWIELDFGGRVAAVRGFEPLTYEWHDGYPYPDRTYPAELLGVNPDSSYVTIVEEPSQDTRGVMHVEVTARWHGQSGEVIGTIDLPLDSQFLHVDRPATLGPDGYVYYLLTQESEVQILRMPWHPA